MSDQIRPLPPLTREVYAAARDASEPDQEVDDRIACATEAVWSRAWRAATRDDAELLDRANDLTVERHTLCCRQCFDESVRAYIDTVMATVPSWDETE